MSRISGRTTKAALAAALTLAAVGLPVGGIAFAANTSHSPSSHAPAGPSGPDLALVHAYVAGGGTTAEQGQPLTFVFSAKNFGPGAGDVSIELVSAQGIDSNATTSSLSCILPGGQLINTDGNFCEPGFIAAGHAAGSIVFTGRVTGRSNVVVKACIGNDSGSTDPKPGNNCRVLRVRVE